MLQKYFHLPERTTETTQTPGALWVRGEVSVVSVVSVAGFSSVEKVLTSLSSLWWLGLHHRTIGCEAVP